MASCSELRLSNAIENAASIIDGIIMQRGVKTHGQRRA